MSEEKKVRTKRSEIDWESIELNYRAGIKTVRQIAAEFGVSHTAIQKKAEGGEWTRNVKEKIKEKVAQKVVKAAIEKVAKVATGAVASPRVATNARISETAFVDATVDIIVSAELLQREDILLSLALSRAHLREVATLSEGKFAAALEALGEAYDTSGPTASGAWKNDKNFELYQYIISLAGRVENAKKIAATHGVYIPLQRKVLKMDDEADTGANAVDDLLARVLANG